jgi:hypothetical protein
MMDTDLRQQFRSSKTQSTLTTLFGQDSLHELRETRNQLIGLMKGGGF